MSLLKNAIALIICLSLAHSIYSMEISSLRKAFSNLSLDDFQPEAPATPNLYDIQLCDAVCLSIKLHEPFQLSLIQNLSKESVNVIFKFAAEFNSPETVKFILNKKNLYQKLIDYSTYATSNALWQAAQHAFPEIVNMILSHEAIRNQLFENDKKLGCYIAQTTVLLAASKPTTNSAHMLEGLPTYFVEKPKTIQQQKIETLQILLTNQVITSRLTAEIFHKAIKVATESGYNDVATFLDKRNNCLLL